MSTQLEIEDQVLTVVCKALQDEWARSDIWRLAEKVGLTPNEVHIVLNGQPRHLITLSVLAKICAALGVGLIALEPQVEEARQGSVRTFREKLKGFIGQPITEALRQDVEGAVEGALDTLADRPVPVGHTMPCEAGEDDFDARCPDCDGTGYQHKTRRGWESCFALEAGGRCCDWEGRYCPTCTGGS